MSTHAICPVEWGEISTKQSVGKCKQINFWNLCVVHHYISMPSELNCLPLSFKLTHAAIPRLGANVTSYVLH